MRRLKGYYEWDDDNLTPGRKSGGGLHQNLFDSEGRLKGSARFVPTSDVDPDPGVVTETIFVPVEERREQEELEESISELFASLIVLGGLLGGSWAKPHVDQWWRKKAHPFMRAQKARLLKHSGKRKATKKNVSEVSENVAGAAQELAYIPEQHRPTKMSSAEAQARYLAALAARAYSDEQMKMVTNSDIVDVDSIAEVRSRLAELPPEEIASLLKMMVTHPSMLGEETLAELASTLGRPGDWDSDIFPQLRHNNE